MRSAVHGEVLRPDKAGAWALLSHNTLHTQPHVRWGCLGAPGVLEGARPSTIPTMLGTPSTLLRTGI